MNTHENTKELNIGEQVNYFVSLAHDELLETWIDGHFSESYESWQDFIHECLQKLINGA